MSTEDGFKKLHTLPLQCNYYYPKPLFYVQNSNEIIISTRNDEDNAGIYKYNMNTNKIELVHKYDSTMSDITSHFIDYKNEILYTFGGYYNTFNAFNLKTNIMNTLANNKPGIYAKSVAIPSANEIHILKDYKNHFIFDFNNKMFTEIDCNRDVLLDSKINNLKLIYCEYNNQLMIFGGDNNDKIFYCNVKKQSME
eukprot:525489_1